MTRLPPQYSGPAWGRWTPQQPAEQQMIVTSPMVPYDTPTTTAGYENKPLMSQPFAPPYVMPNSYSPGSNYDTSIRTQYQPQMAYDYNSYPSPNAGAPLGAPFKPQYQHRPDVRLLSPANSTQGYLSPHMEGVKGERYDEQASSPMSRSNSQAFSPNMTPISTPMLSTKTVNPIVPDNPAERAEFHTPVDDLLRKAQMLQAVPLPSSPQQLLTPVQSPRSEMQAKVPNSKAKAKTFQCRKCPKVCAQKAHLKAHERMHEGDKPFTCHICGNGHTQKGNLRAHIRAHKDERIFKCPFHDCTRDFTARSTLDAHKRTHNKDRPRWVCKLESCTKDFSTVGNMKNHHVKFHQEEFTRLMRLIDNAGETGVVSDADRATVEELKFHYRNSNKGIKGRGKGVKVQKVGRVTRAEPIPASSRFAPPGLNDAAPMVSTPGPQLPIYQSVSQPSPNGALYRPSPVPQVPYNHGRLY